MQAKESLNFVEPFTQGEVDRTTIEKMHSEQRFLRVCLELLDRYPDNVRTHEVLEESGFMTAFESSLTLQFSDASYLHVLVFGHSNEGGYVDFNIAIEEHDENKLPTDGYIYNLSGEGLVRFTAPRQVENYDDIEDPHFSLIEMYNGLEELSDLQASSNEEVKEYAREARTAIEQEVSLGMWESEINNDGQAPTYKEIEKLTSLLVLASPRVRS